ncbi:MAG: IS4 family transposase [Bacteroidales bacterium]|nr:IS4 family transposase [Bacteroidales bacterium]
MNKSKYVFAQLTTFLDRNHFNYIARKYGGNRYVKHFTCWNRLLVMMFGQLSNRGSLRDVIVAIEAHRSKSYHLGFGKNVSKTSLARANQTRDYRIFEDFAYYLVGEARHKRATNIFRLDGNVYAFDSTTISLCLDVFWWAKFRSHKGGVKIHTLYDLETQIPAFFHITTASVHDSKAMKQIPVETGAYYIFDRAYNNFKELYRIHRAESFFVVRAKTNLQYKNVKWRRRLPKGILTDAVIELTVYGSQKGYPEQLRLVRFFDEEQGRDFMFLTNAMKLTALQVADLYKNRWQIELFFKWLKQHLKIKKFWGTTENAVRIQIYSAICAYCLVVIVQHDMHLDRSTYEVLQILSMSLTDTTPLKELFNKTIFKNDKERFGFDGPDLFDNID